MPIDENTILALVSESASLHVQVKRIISRIDGNGQPGFIKETQAAIADLNKRQAVADAVDVAGRATEAARDRAIEEAKAGVAELKEAQAVVYALEASREKTFKRHLKIMLLAVGALQLLMSVVGRIMPWART